jgi:hypothetical protein
VLIWTAWQGSACAVDQKLPEDVFTEHSPGVPRHGTSTGVLSRNSSTREGTTSTGEEAGEAPDRRRMVAADPERKHHPDLLGEEDSAISNWRRWKRRWRGVFCPRRRRRWSSELAGIDKRRRRRSSRQRARGSARRASEGLGWVGGSTQTRAWRS